MTTAAEGTLRRAADLFHEIVSAHTADDLLSRSSGPALIVIRDRLRDSLRSRDQIKKLASDGFELCVRALAEMGAPDVTIHECGTQALGETPWSGSDE